MQKKILIPLAVLATFGMVACQPSTPSSSSIASSGTTSSAASSVGSSSESSSSSSQAALPLAGAGAASLINYQGKTYAEKSKILASLESYAMTKHLAGIPLYDSGSLAEFSNRVTLPTRTYITNYGFGTENATIDPTGIAYDNVISESNSDWTSYFHEATTADSGTLNYWDSTGQDVADEYGTVEGNLYNVKMNDAKDGYTWRGVLSSADRPVLIDANGNPLTYTEGKLSTTWRVPVKTGADYKYHTLSSAYSSFNDTPIELADYLTPVKAMLGVYGKAALKRGTDISGSASGFAGASDFLGATTYDLTTDDWTTSGVGFQLNADQSSIDITFASAKTQFAAMYAIADSLFAPVPQSFIKALGVTALGAGKTDAEYYAAGIQQYGMIGSSSTDPTLNIDNVLSTGAYDAEYWEKSKTRAYKKNPNFVFANEINFTGIREDDYEGANSDVAMFNAFKANTLDEVVVPTAYVSTHKNDANTLKVPGDTTMKMNTNSCTDSEWEYYFGTDGVVYPHTVDKYWDVKAVMSNDEFLDGVYFSIDRTELANLQGRSPALGYLSDAYMVDPESGVGYRSSDDGKGVLADYAIGTNKDGHDDATAQTYFADSIQSMIADGSVHAGTADNPTTITLQYLFRYQTTIDSIGSYLKKYVEDNFNAACAVSLGVKLVLSESVAGSSYIDCYTKMDQGEYDFADGAITGAVLDPISFMDTICTDTLAQGFCLNWGERTDLVSDEDPVIYNGLRWSYDALWTVANGTGVVKNGLVTPILSVDDTSYGNDGTNVKLALDYTEVLDTSNVSVWTFALHTFRIFIADDSSFDNYGGFDLTDDVGADPAVYDFQFTIDTVNKKLVMTCPIAVLDYLANLVSKAYGVTADYFDFEFTPQYTATVPDVGVTTTAAMFDIVGNFEDFDLAPVTYVVPSSSASAKTTALPGNGNSLLATA
jgi:hypothetical protein